MRFSMTAAFVLCAAAGGALANDAPLYTTRDCSREMVQTDMNICAGANLDAADAELNRVYQQLMSQQTDQKSKNQLRDLERTWIAYRDKECAEEVGPQEGGGTIWPLEMDSCLQKKTDARIRELKSQLS
jgi:uncharacterized protein YecT (DUF1311 family)